MKTMPKPNLGFLLTPLPGHLSVDAVTIASGAGKLEAGTVLGKIEASGEYVASPAALVAGKEGAENAVAILGYAVDATENAIEVTVVSSICEVKESMLIFDASVDDETKTAAKIDQLAAVGIKAR